MPDPKIRPLPLLPSPRHSASIRGIFDVGKKKMPCDESLDTGIVVDLEQWNSMEF